MPILFISERAYCIAPLQPSTLAAFPPWGIPRELAVQDSLMFFTAFPLKAAAKVRILNKK